MSAKFASIFIFFASMPLMAGGFDQLPEPEKVQSSYQSNTQLPAPKTDHEHIFLPSPQLSGVYVGVGGAHNTLSVQNDLALSEGLGATYAGLFAVHQDAIAIDHNANRLSPVFSLGWWGKPHKLKKKHSVYLGFEALYQPESGKTSTKKNIGTDGGAPIFNRFEVKPHGKIGLLGNVALELVPRLYGVIGGGVTVFPNVNYKVSLGGSPWVSSGQSLFGGLGKLGFAYRLSSKIGLNLSYLYTQTENKQFHNREAPGSINLSSHQLMMMLNWHFGKAHPPKRQRETYPVSPSVLRPQDIG